MKCFMCGTVLDTLELPEVSRFLPNGWASEKYGADYCWKHTPDFAWSLSTTQFGKMVRALRKANKISQDEFAKLAGVSTPTLAKVEAGSLSVRMQTLNKIYAVINKDALLGLTPIEQ